MARAKKSRSAPKTPRRNKAISRKTAPAGALVRPSRTIDDRTALFLYTQAGGRCEFDNCNEYLLEHSPTGSPGNYGEKAHIWAFNEGGPRGTAAGRPTHINVLENLMLLCKSCHHLVDKVRPQDFPVPVLRKFKQEHEARIFDLTGLSKDRDTIPVVLKGLIAGRPMDISDEEMQAAVAPNYLRRRDKIEIDLTSLPDKLGAAYWDSGCAAIDQKIDALQRLLPRPDRTLRLSVFALAPIPFLVYLGSKLTDKQVVELYQRHRTPESWQWSDGQGSARFQFRRLDAAGEGAPVALLVNVSGQNRAAEVKKSLGECTVYELTTEGQAPTPLVLKTCADLERFTAEYVRGMARLRAEHPQLAQLHVFPAVPAPIGITLGRSRLPKVDPVLTVYDRDDRAGGFLAALEIR